MNDDEHVPATDPQERDPRPASPRAVNPHLVRNLAIVFAIIALGFGFGRPIAAGYYLGGCNHAEATQHYLIHVFGIEMCRDVPVAGEAESRARQAAEASPLPELTQELPPETIAPAPAGGEQAHS